MAHFSHRPSRPATPALYDIPSHTPVATPRHGPLSVNTDRSIDPGGGGDTVP